MHPCCHHHKGETPQFVNCHRAPLTSLCARVVLRNTREMKPALLKSFACNVPHVAPCFYPSRHSHMGLWAAMEKQFAREILGSRFETHESALHSVFEAEAFNARASSRIQI